MDGNRRWAKKNSLSYMEGYTKGASSIKDVMELAFDRKIPYITLYAFSTENWGRQKSELKVLMSILEHYLTHEIDTLMKHNIKLNTIGNVEKFEEKIKQKIEQALEKTCNNTGVTLTLALNYGAREEIVHAIKNLFKSSVNVTKLDESLFSSFLYTHNLPDPDLIIRTGGEQRLSNFLLWQSTYAEIFFCKKMWPEFTKEDLDNTISWFQARDRKWGLGEHHES